MPACLLLHVGPRQTTQLPVLLEQTSQKAGHKQQEFDLKEKPNLHIVLNCRTNYCKQDLLYWSPIRNTVRVPIFWEGECTEEGYTVF